MAYNIAGNLNPIDISGNYLAARQARQQSDRQNMLFEQQQQDRAAQQQAEQQSAQTKAQQAAYEWGVNAVGVLAPLKDRPEEFARGRDVLVAEAARRGIPLTAEEVTPERVAALEAQLRIRGGIAQPEPDPAKGPNYGLGNVNPGDYTPESLAAYAQTVNPQTGVGNYAVLKRQYAPQSAWIGNVAGGVAVAPRVGGDVGAPRFLVDPSTNIAGNARAAQAEATAKEVGQAQGTATAALPTIETQAQQTTTLIDRLLDHPGLKASFGLRGMLPTVPGSEAANFAAELDQLKGQVFLAAYSQLKGGGAITEQEGKKAEVAIAALNNAQSVESVVANLKRLKEVIDNGVAAARRKAGQARPGAAAPAAIGTPIKLNNGATLERLD